MRLYSATTAQFVEDTLQNQISEKVRQEFVRQVGWNPGIGELHAWQNSLRAMCQVVQYAGLHDQGLIVEYQLPFSSLRVDCIVCGVDLCARDNAVIVELKQWDKCDPADGDSLVITWVGGDEREVLHPSAQAERYQTYLRDQHSAFSTDDPPVVLDSCAYLHNYRLRETGEVLVADKFKGLIGRCPLFSADDVNPLSSFLVERVGSGDGARVLGRVEASKYRASKKLMEHVGDLIVDRPAYTLLDDQQVVFEKVMSAVRQGFHDKRKAVIVVKGGPGTGKSLIALNLMGHLSSKHYNAHYVTGSRAFTQTLRSIIGTRGSSQFRYTSDYVGAEPNAVDVLICDEAHRIRDFTTNRYAGIRSNVPQVQEIVNAAKVSVFFIDDAQVVRPGESGSSSLIKDAASLMKCKTGEYELTAQFRCSGSDAFINWVNHTLGIQQTANETWHPEDPFEFRIFASPLEMEDEIRKRVGEGYSARMTAGFCWPWSAKPNADGTLKDDVQISDYRRPWNARPEATRLARGIPKATLWAHDPTGINQVGCIYTAQGFEFDYVGVIFGNDLAYNLTSREWEGHPECSHDGVVKRAGGTFLSLVKNTYRVLLTRGLRGCYVCFTDEATERYFRSRMLVH